MDRIKILFLLFIVSFVPLGAQNLNNPETRGVWVTGNYLQGGSTAIETMVKKLSDANFNVIFLDVWYEGSTIYSSNVVKSAGGPAQNPDFSGDDPLRNTIDIAHRYGIQVFAWFEYGFSVGYSYDSTGIPPILKLHPDWSMTQKDTTKHFDSEDVYFFWVDPAVNAASKFIVDLYTECAGKYPDIDGIELDRMRYPAKNFSYSDSSRIKFMNETNNPDPLTLEDNNRIWSAWRRQQVTNVVKNIYQNVKQLNPGCIVTGAVVPPYMMFGSSDDKLQAWDVWAKNSYADILEPMLYLVVDDFQSQLNSCLNYVPAGYKLSPGIAISSAGSVSNAITEINFVRNSGVSGQVIWYYGDMLSYPDAFSSLKSIYQYKSDPDFDDLIVDNSTAKLFTTTGNWSNNTGGYNGTYQKSVAEVGDTAVYKVRVLRSGKYSLYGYWTGDSSGNYGNVSVEITSNTIHETDTVNQQTGLNAWNFVNKFSINSGDTITIKMFGTGGKNLIADAFRLKRTDGIVSSVKENITGPKDYNICQNYPNPFNPSTTIKFSLPFSAKVSIDIYNVLGEKVNELLQSREFNTGSWEIRFNGSALSSGIYFAVIRMQGQKNSIQKTLKMILLK